MKNNKNMIILTFVLLSFTFLFNCESEKKYVSRIDFFGKKINYSVNENNDTNLYDKYINRAEYYKTNEFSIIIQPVEEKRKDFPYEIDNYKILNLVFVNSLDTLSLLKFSASYYWLFETEDFYYFPYTIDIDEHDLENAIYKLGLLIIYKKSFKYDTISFTNEAFVSFKQRDNKLIVKTNRLTYKLNILGFIINKLGGHAPKYSFDNNDEYKEYKFYKK